MRRTTPVRAERRPHRSRLDHPDRLTGSFRPSELVAGLAAVAVVAQCALAPVSLLVAGLLALVGRISRWQLTWLLLPAVGSACWLAVAGPLATAHALAAGAGRLMAADLAAALHPGRLLHPAAVFAGSGRWLPTELPLLLLAGTAEAAIVLWPHRTRRPGLVAVLRRRAAAAALAAGHTVTASGFTIGVDGSGRLSGVSWAQAERGVLLTGGDPLELDQIGLAIACAAVRRRKAMLVLDLTAAGATRDHVSCDRDHPSCDRDHLSCGRDHVSCGRDHVSCGRDHPSCDPAGLTPVLPRSVVDGRMKRARTGRLDRRGAGVCAQVAGLAERAGAPVSCVGSVADRAPGASEAAAARGARTSDTVSLNGAFGRAIRRRSVVLLPAHHAVAARSEATQRALSELVGTLISLRELGLRGDCLVWVVGCEAAEASRLSDLLSLGHATGTAVVLSTTSPEVAADLAGDAGVVVASGPISGNLAQRLADLADGNSGIASPIGHGLPIDAPLWASIGNTRPSALELARDPDTAKRLLADILQTQRPGLAMVIAHGAISARGSFLTVPIEVTEVR
jgi:hypothetical protein